MAAYKVKSAMARGKSFPEGPGVLGEKKDDRIEA